MLFRSLEKLSLALDASDVPAVTDILGRNLAFAEGGQVALMGDYVMRLQKSLDQQTDADLTSGKVTFPEPK